MTLKFIHTADWQIGSKFTNFDPEDAYALFDARFDVVEKIAKYANTNNIDMVVVAGDVFDTQTVSDRTIMRMFNAMNHYKGLWIFISGNHDAALAESVWQRAQRLDCIKDNMYLALNNETITIDKLNLMVLPAPLTQRHTTLDATQWFDTVTIPKDKFVIGIAHGSVQGIMDHAITNNLINVDREVIKQLDYLALGDWHGTQQINSNCWYSGTPETDRFRNNDSGNILEVEIEAPGGTPSVKKINTSRYKWFSWEFNILIPADVDVLINQLNDLNQEHLLEIKIAGSVSLVDKQKLNKALSVCKAAVRALRVNDNELKIQPTDQDIADLNVHGYVGQVVQILQENNENEALLALAEIILEAQNEA